MTAFNRILRPVFATPFERTDGSKVSVSHTGVVQARGGYMAGLAWTEEYEPMPYTDPDLWAFWEYLQRLKRTREFVEYALTDIWGHPGLLGDAAGAILVAGADQVGSTLTTDGGTGTLKAGNILRVTGINHSFVVTADAALPGDIGIHPAILTGGSPADNAPVLFGATCTIRVMVHNIYKPTVEGDKQAYIGLRVDFREAP